MKYVSKKQILNKIKSITDPKLLRELDTWIKQAESEKRHKPEHVREPANTYQTVSSPTKAAEKTPLNQDSGSAIDWLEKIAVSGGIKGIEDPVEWQKRERRDCTLSTS